MFAYVPPKKVALLITAKQNVSFKGFSAKQQKKPKKGANYSVIEQNALSDKHPKMTGQNDRPDESMTGQAHDQAGHCPLTGRYFEPCELLNFAKKGIK